MCRAVKPVQARGRLAQLGEHLPYKQRVIGSSPITPTIYSQIGLRCGPVVQLVRMPACHAGGRRFEPVPDRQFYNDTICWCGSTVEQLICNQQVGGSIPSTSSSSWKSPAQRGDAAGEKSFHSVKLSTGHLQKLWYNSQADKISRDSRVAKGGGL